MYCDLPALQYDSDRDSDDEIIHTNKVTRKKSVNDIIGNTFESDSDSDSESDTANNNNNKTSTVSDSNIEAILPQHKKGSLQKSIVTARLKHRSNSSNRNITNRITHSSDLIISPEVTINNETSRPTRIRRKSERQIQFEEYKANQIKLNHIQKSARSSYSKQEAVKRKTLRKVVRANRSVDLHSNRIRINGLFNTLASEWTKECPWCGYMHLNSATVHMRSNCCFNGKLSPLSGSPMYERYAHLEPLSKEMRKLMIDDIEHFGPLSAAYNNMLSISRVGVTNGKIEAGVPNTHPGGFERRVGDHASIVSGRTYHCMPKFCNSLAPACKQQMYLYIMNITNELYTMHRWY